MLVTAAVTMVAIGDALYPPEVERERGSEEGAACGKGCVGPRWGTSVAW
jgi:hypothetical protein